MNSRSFYGRWWTTYSKIYLANSSFNRYYIDSAIWYRDVVQLKKFHFLTWLTLLASSCQSYLNRKNELRPCNKQNKKLIFFLLHPLLDFVIFWGPLVSFIRVFQYKNKTTINKTKKLIFFHVNFSVNLIWNRENK